MSTNLKYTVILFTLVILAFLIGIFAGIVIFKKTISNASPKPIQIEPVNPFFNSQTANTRGKITKIEGNKVTVENESKLISEFELLATFSVIQVDPNNKASFVPPAMVSDQTKIAENLAKNLKKIELGKEGLIYFSGYNQSYKVVSITYFPPIPPLGSPPPPSSPTTIENSQKSTQPNPTSR